MSQRNSRYTISATIVLIALLSLLVWGQGTTPPQASKSKATAKRKSTARKTTPPAQTAQPAQPQAAPVQPAQPAQTTSQPAPPQSETPPQALQAAPTQPATVPAPSPQTLAPSPQTPPPPSSLPQPTTNPQSALPATPAQVTTAPAQPGGAVATVGPKKPGVLRIGVVLPITQLSPDTTLALSDAIRQLLISYLNGPIAEAIPLEARVPVQLEVEAKQKECDFVFYSAVARAQRSSSFATIMKNATPVVGLIPGTGAATAAAGTAATAAATTTDKVLKAATDLSSNIKAKDEVSVTFKLAAPGQATPKLNHVLKAKAKTDGDQVLSTLLAEAANAVLQAATQK